MTGVLKRLQLALVRAGRRALAQLSIAFIFVPIALLALAIAGYGWWWRVVADGVRANTMAFQVAQRDLGRQLTWDGVEIQGFPYRVEATISTLHFTAPDHGAAYDGERIVMQVLPLALHRVAFSLEGKQHFFYAKENWIEATARADKALVTIAGRSSEQSLSLDIERLTGKANVDATNFNFIVEQASGGVNVSQQGEREALPRVDLVAKLENIALQGKLDLPLGPSVGLVEIDAGLKFPADLKEASARTLFAAWQRTGTPIEVRRFELEWGGVSIAATGEFKLDAGALPEGRFRLKLGNHPRILELLEAGGWITRETHLAAKPVLDVLAFISGDAKRRVSIPLAIKNGDVYLGPARIATLVPRAASAQLAPTLTEQPVGLGP